MFNKDGLFGRKDDDPQRAEPRSVHVNVTPELRGTPARSTTSPPAPPPETLLERSLTTPRAAAPTEDSPGSKLIVGPDIKLKGVEITDCDTLVVEGRVEASMDSRVVQIAQSGVFTGNATMDVAEIWGSFEGQLTVRKQLVIYASGRVSGTIRYGQIRIEEGGELSGDVSTLAGAQANTRRPAAPAAASSTAKVAQYEPIDRPAAQTGKSTAGAK